MTEIAFSFADVTKRFGTTEALRGISFAVPAGSVVGLVGRNGAGKSTIIRCLMGLQRPSTGEVRLLGHDPWDLPVPVKQRIGYMSERPLPFPGMRVNALFAFCRPLYPTWDRALEERLLTRFQIDGKAKLASLSLGKQRTVALLLAICPRPEVLVLDEPAANLDAVARREFLDQVIDLVAEAQRTVLISTHILGDLERIADRVLLIDQGRIRMHRELDDLRQRVRRLRLIFADQAPAAVPVARALSSRRLGREWLLTVDDFDVDLPARVAHQTGARVEVQTLGLEDLFVDLVGDKDHRNAAAA